jgi:hypothetical protein
MRMPGGEECEIRSFRNLYTYYRRLISVSNIEKPGIKLMEENQASQWTPEMEDDFRILKEALYTVPFPRSQVRVLPLTQTRITWGLEEAYHKYRMHRSK